MRLLILTLIFSFSSCFADPIDPSIVAAFASDPSVIVESCVNALTGDFIVSETDLSVQGEIPIEIRRTYMSGNGYGKNGGWQFIPHQRLFFKPPKRKKTRRFFPTAEIYLENGSLLTLSQDENDRTKYQCDLRKKLKGITNLARGPIGGGSFVKNLKLDLEDPSKAMLSYPDEIIGIYEKAYYPGREQLFLLKKEVLRCGNLRHFEYDTCQRLKKIKTTNRDETKTFSWVTFDYLMPLIEGCDCDITASDGQLLSYRFSESGDHFLLSKVIHPDGSEEQLTYTKPDAPFAPLIQTRNDVEIEYYPVEGNEVQNSKAGKVKTLITPNKNYLFEYFITRNQEGDHYTYGKSGSTQVTDGKDAITLFHYTNHFLPTKIEYSNKDKHDIHFWWTPDGLLTTKKTRECSRSFEYDTTGNVITDSLSGDLTGDGMWDTYIVKREFDEQNRVRKIEEDNGKIVCLEYVDETYLIKEKSIGDQKKTWLTAIYEYDTDNMLSQIVYSGSKIRLTKNPNDEKKSLKKKKQEPLAKRQNVRGQISWALYPNEIQEHFSYNFDGTLKQHVNTEGKKILYEYDILGRVTRKQVFSYLGRCLYEEENIYDAFHLLETIDSSGFKTEFHYDATGKRIEDGFVHNTKKKKSPSLPKNNIDRKYDHKGNLIKEVKWLNDKQLVTQHTYTLSNKLSSTTLPDKTIIDRRYDELGRLTKITSSDHTIHYSIAYDLQKRTITVKDHINHGSSVRHYSKYGYLLEERLLNGKVLKSQYDSKGRRTLLKLPDSSSIRYRHDKKYLRVIERISSTGDILYKHELAEHNDLGFPIHQRLIKNGGNLHFEIDENSHIAAVKFDKLELKHDASLENQAAEERNDVITYDALGRIIKIQTSTKLVYFIYDFWNRPMRKKVFEKLDDQWIVIEDLAFLSDDMVEIGAIDLVSGKIKQLKVCASETINAGDDAIAYEIEGRVYTPLHDLNGNVSMLLHKNKILERYQYSELADEKIHNHSMDAANPWRFGSCRIDDHTGLLFIGNKVYDPMEKHFCTEPLKPPKLVLYPKEIRSPEEIPPEQLTKVELYPSYP